MGTARDQRRAHLGSVMIDQQDWAAGNGFRNPLQLSSLRRRFLLQSPLHSFFFSSPAKRNPISRSTVKGPETDQSACHSPDCRLPLGESQAGRWPVQAGFDFVCDVMGCGDGQVARGLGSRRTPYKCWRVTTGLGIRAREDSDEA